MERWHCWLLSLSLPQDSVEHCIIGVTILSQLTNEINQVSATAFLSEVSVQFSHSYCCVLCVCASFGGFCLVGGDCCVVGVSFFIFYYFYAVTYFCGKMLKPPVLRNCFVSLASSIFSHILMSSSEQCWLTSRAYLATKKLEQAALLGAIEVYIVFLIRQICCSAVSGCHSPGQCESCHVCKCL